MQLTQQTDYALRMLIYLSKTPDQGWVGVREISDAYQISHNHMLKVTQSLVALGFLESKRGAMGGVRLEHRTSSQAALRSMRSAAKRFSITA
jgi:Rrf2 family transcriptional regulator, nitric oxide-sensitive transcriptional repressor